MLSVDEYGDPLGTDEDDDNIRKTFAHLNFAVYSIQDPLFRELVNLVETAAEFHLYPLNYKFIAFYYSGHGGVDRDGHEFVLPLQLTGGGREDIVYINDAIISPFTCKYAVQIRDQCFFDKHKRNRTCLFFFDCCLKYNPDLVPGTERVFNLHCPYDCLVAYATSVNLISGGNATYGGLWTRYLCQRLIKRDLLSAILDHTVEDVRDDQAGNNENVTYQLPYYKSNAGEIYLKGICI